MTNEIAQRPALIECGEDTLLAVKDTMLLLSGKWKIQILGRLMISGKMRFMDLRREIPGIGAKMLTRELLELEQNRLIVRQVMATKPVTVEYDLTPHGETLLPIIKSLGVWGIFHRQHLFKS